MVRKIVWSKRAEAKFTKILNYLDEHWSRVVTENFLNRTYEFLDILIEYPEIGQMQHLPKNLRGFTLTKHTIVFYKIKGQTIVLVDFFDNRQQAKK